MRAVAEPMLASQFGEQAMDGFFSRFTETAASLMASRKMEYFNIVVALRRKNSESCQCDDMLVNFDGYHAKIGIKLFTYAS
ncbi:S-adenosyl-L-methionine:benzoic acid/salicylic acid carboxyl methyltransferase 3-like protein [Drosera capensis]